MKFKFNSVEMKKTKKTVKRSYLLKASFDPKEFIAYYKLRRENLQCAPEGALEQINDCLQYTSGSAIANAILTALQKSYEIPSLKNIFDKMVCS